MVDIELRNVYRAYDLWSLARNSRDAKQAPRLMGLAGVAAGLSSSDDIADA